MKTTMESIRGFTLIEMIIVLAVFTVVLLISASAFKTILSNTQITFGSERSSTEGVVGMEMLRHDLQQAGFALFTDEFHVPTYAEAAAAPYSTYNDANAVPRAIVTDDNVNSAPVLTGTDYLAIKATTVGGSTASQQWSYVTDTGIPKRWGAHDFVDGTDKLIALKQYYDRNTNQVYRSLVQVSNTNYAFRYFASGLFRDQNNTLIDNYSPPTSSQYYLYGIDSSSDTSFALRAPFNRVDYFVSRQAVGVPDSCSADAGILYKSIMNQSDGSFTDIPILDCVADMQIVLGWNTQNNPESLSTVDAFSDAKGVATSGNLNGLNIQTIMQNAAEVRNRLKLIKVYVLAQDGGRDLNFINTNNTMIVGDSDQASLTKIVDLTTANKRNYRWKVYRDIVRPMNL